MPAWRPAHRVNQFCPHLARMGPSAGVASTGDTPEWDVSGTEPGRRRRGRTSWPVRRVLVATLRSAWREDLCLWACRRPGLLHIRHQAWVAPVAVLPLPVSGTSMRATGQVRQHVRWYRIGTYVARHTALGYPHDSVRPQAGPGLSTVLCPESRCCGQPLPG